MHRLPNALSLFRIAMVPVLAGLAWTGEAGLFLAGLCASLGSDVADGFLARRTGATSELGAKLDSWGDLATWLTLPLFAWWLWPELLRAEAPVLAVAAVAYTAPLVAGLLRWRRLTSYHTWGAKLASVVGGSGALWLFAGGPAWLFHAGACVLVIEAVEELAITAVIPRWRADVPTLWHALTNPE